MKRWDIAAIAEVVDRLDVYDHIMALPYPARVGPPCTVRVVNKTHLVTHLADMLGLRNPGFDRVEFYVACGLSEEERYLA